MAAMKKGLRVVVSGPAGSGKGTVNGELIKKEGFAFSVSATTRAPRPGEVDGVNYYFVTHEEFERRLAAGEMLEYTQYCEEVLAREQNLILEIEVEGAMNVKAKYPDAVLIMLLPPTHAIQEARLRGRGTETEEKGLLRLARTREEGKLFHKYDYIVYNYDNRSDEAVADILSIVRAEQLRASRNPTAEADFFAN